MSTQNECPICHGHAVRLHSKTSGPFWKCQNDNCAKFFRDDAGKLVAPVACPKCGKPALSRYASHQRPGQHFWRCDACTQFFGDNDGKPAAAFVDEEKTSCPACGGQAVRRITLDTKQWYWACAECGKFADIDGAIGGPLDGIVQ